MSLRTAIVARLMGNVPLLQGRVLGVADLEAALQGNIKSESAFVWRDSVTTTPNDKSSAVQQRITQEFCVLIATKNVKDTGGMDSTDTSDAICEQVRNALIGWMPDGISAITYNGGNADFKRNSLYWMERFEHSSYIIAAYRS